MVLRVNQVGSKCFSSSGSAVTNLEAAGWSSGRTALTGTVIARQKEVLERLELVLHPAKAGIFELDLRRPRAGAPHELEAEERRDPALPSQQLASRLKEVVSA